MRRRLVAWNVLSLSLLVLGCQDGSRSHSPAVKHEDPQQVRPDASVEKDAGEPTGPIQTHDAGKPPVDAGSMKDAGRPAADAGGKQDAAAPPTKPADAAVEDASSRDASHEDASVEDAAADSGEPPIPPRTDGCDEAAPLALDRVRIRPASGQAAQLVGARIQGSNSGPTTDFVDLTTITQAPADGAYAELTFANSTLYRYLRYYAPPGSPGGVAEIAFYHGPRQLSGTGFGTAIGDAQHPYGHALDGNTATYFAAAAGGGGAYVGLDIARGYVTQSVKFSPDATTATTPIDVVLSSSTAGAVIRYSTDGGDPTATSPTYSTPIHLTQGRTNVRAFASSSCRFDSAVTSSSYTIGGSTPVGGGLKTYHIGNSLTDTINPWLEPIADSTGVDHIYARWTIPGAPIKWLAEHQGEGFEDPEGASRFDTFVRTFAPIDHLSLQPYSDPDFESQGGAAINFMKTALQYSPNIQFWIYAQWPGKTEWATDAMSNGYADWPVPKKPANWAEGTQNYALYFEAFRDYVDPKVDGKPLLIVPGGLALVELKRQIDAGLIPGYTDFFASMFEDEVHLTKPAQYLVSLVFYACLYRQTPESRVTSAGTGLTAQQAQIFQRIAWSIASAYRGSGIVP